MFIGCQSYWCKRAKTLLSPPSKKVSTASPLWPLFRYDARFVIVWISILLVIIRKVHGEKNIRKS